GQAASFAKNLAKERINFSLSSRKPRSSSSESVFVQESPEHIRQLRIPIVVLAVDLFTALGQVVFQVPQIRRLLDLVGHSLCFLNHFVNLPSQSSVEDCADDGVFCPRPNRLVLVGIGGWALSRMWNGARC